MTTPEREMPSRESSQRIAMLFVIDATIARVRSCEADIDGTPRWRWLRRRRLAAESERLLGEAETLMREHDQRWPPRRARG
jgi:hypothetical protein